MKDMVVNKRVSWGSERVELEKDMRDERSGKSDAHFYVYFFILLGKGGSVNWTTHLLLIV